MKDTLVKIKNNLQGINSGGDEAKNQTKVLQHKEAKNNQSEQEEKRILFVSSLWDNFKRSDIYIIGVPEGEEKKQEIGKLFEKITKKHFPNLVKEIVIQVQEAQSPKQDGPKWDHIIKIRKVKDRDS